MARIALLAFALVAAGCRQGRPPLVLDRAEGLALSGSPVAVYAALDPACSAWSAPLVQLASGAPLPSWLTATAQWIGRPGCIFVGNPGANSPFDAGSATAPVASPAPECLAGYMVTFLAAPGAPADPVDLVVRATGCGLEGEGRYGLQVVGAAGRPGMCGWSSGGTCGSDEGCGRVGFYGLLCAEAGAAAPIDEPWSLACADPVVTGASCGCVAGACAWH